jgi:hypothetical protein
MHEHCWYEPAGKLPLEAHALMAGAILALVDILFI